jgi:hypothetical protein
VCKDLVFVFVYFATYGSVGVDRESCQPAVAHQGLRAPWAIKSNNSGVSRSPWRRIFKGCWYLSVQTCCAMGDPISQYLTQECLFSGGIGQQAGHEY